MKRLFLTGAAVLVALGGTAEGADKANTKVKFGGANSNADHSTTYYGNIESPRRACANKRRVAVFMKGPGPDDRIGSAKSQPGKSNTYFWEVVQEDSAQAGTYYAKARKTQDCRGDRSRDYLYAR